MKITKATAQGRRSYQEDAYFILTTSEGTYLAVLDGHGGNACAEYCAAMLPIILHSKPILRDALAELNEKARHMHSGSTVSIVFIPTSEDVVYTAVLGDSPIIIKRKDGSIWVSPEHNVRTNLAEADAAIERGGFVKSGYLFAKYTGQGLQMSRALGDAALDRVLSREPDVSAQPIGPGSYVLVATDGAVDPSHANEAAGIAKIVNLLDAGGEAQNVVDRALAIHTNDNVTALLVRL